MTVGEDRAVLILKKLFKKEAALSNARCKFASYCFKLRASANSICGARELCEDHTV